MARPAQRLKVTIFIGAAVCFRGDVVNRGCRDWLPVAQALLTNVPVTLQDARAYNIPFTAIAALMSALSPLMLLPAFITMVNAVARAVCSSLSASKLPACACDS